MRSIATLSYIILQSNMRRFYPTRIFSYIYVIIIIKCFNEIFFSSDTILSSSFFNGHVVLFVITSMKKDLINFQTVLFSTMPSLVSFLKYVLCIFSIEKYSFDFCKDVHFLAFGFSKKKILTCFWFFHFLIYKWRLISSNNFHF